MQEPKKYTAKEAMHWMIDNPEKQMRYVSSASGNVGHIYFLSHRFIGDSGVNIQYFHRVEGDFYILSEYKAWQAALKAEADKAKESEPREGESLYKYMKRDGGDYKKQSELEDSRQRWIESYVRREIKKALCGTVDVTVR